MYDSRIICNYYFMICFYFIEFRHDVVRGATYDQVITLLSIGYKIIPIYFRYPVFIPIWLRNVAVGRNNH